jgi:hypothetical protein
MNKISKKKDLNRYHSCCCPTAIPLKMQQLEREKDQLRGFLAALSSAALKVDPHDVKAEVACVTDISLSARRATCSRR